MKQQWEKLAAKLDAMSLRERVMIFFAAAVLLLTLLNTLLLDPIFVRQKAQRSQLMQQQQLLGEVQSQINMLLQENSPNSTSPQRIQINQLKKEIAEGNIFLQSNRDRLVQPDKMAEHLRHLLQKNSRLQLVSLNTLAVTTLIEQAAETGREQNNSNKAVAEASVQSQVYKHGVQITLRGSYLDLLQYLIALEKLPQQMYWAKLEMNVVQYPTSEITLILYTLSLDKTWLKV